MLNECNVIRYAAYRVAAKLRIVQHTLSMEHVRLGLIAGVFDRHHLHSTENDILVECIDLEAVIHDIFFAAQKETQNDIQVDLGTELMIKFLLDVYDRNESKTIKIISAKTCLVVLSSSRLQEKYQYLFHQFADHNNCISRKKLACYLENLTQITDFLSESQAFGEELIPASVKCCFKNSRGPLGVTESDFLGWVVQEPQLLVWLSTFYRMHAAETVIHPTKCSSCKMYPIVGLRYRCLQCLRFDQCQNCFFMGKLSKHHKLKHPMEEYSSKISSTESTVTFLRILKNKLCGTSSTLRYLPVQYTNASGTNRHISDDLKWEITQCDAGGNRDLVDEVELIAQPVPVTTDLFRSQGVQPHCELQSIIYHLEQDNRQLQLDIDKLWANQGIHHVGEYLKDHRKLVETQVQRLKQLKVQLLQMRPPQPRRLMQQLESTPVQPSTFKHGRRCVASPLALENISPILREEDETRPPMECKELRAGDTFDVAAQRGGEGEASLPSSSLSDCSAADLSSWVGEGGSLGRTTSPSGLATWLQDSDENSGKKLQELHEDLDQILLRLQTMLTTNFGLEETLNCKDNEQLLETTTAIEGWLTSLVDEVENQRRSSGHSFSPTAT